MTSLGKLAAAVEDVEVMMVWKSYRASSSDELSLREGDIVEVLDTSDPTSPKRRRLDPELDTIASSDLLDNSAAKHKLSVKPRRTHIHPRQQGRVSTITPGRRLVRDRGGEHKEGWVPAGILQPLDEPEVTNISTEDALFRREAVVRELVETEQEFVRDLQHVVQYYYTATESGKVPRNLRDNHSVIFGNIRQIAEFHCLVLVEGVKYYASEPHMLGKVFLRLERDFDKHVAYCRDEPNAQHILQNDEEIKDYFEELSQQLGDDKTLSEHLKLPIQRINDYQLLLKELVRYSNCLSEESSDLERALELMLSIPHRAQDEKFISNIEGYHGSVHKLGRLLTHDWFSVTNNDGSVTKERYLFLFKARILVCKVRRISEDRSVFQLKETIRLPEITVCDHPDDERIFELRHPSDPAYPLILAAKSDNIKEFWLEEIKDYAKDIISPGDSLAVSQIESVSTEKSLIAEEASLSSTRSEEYKSVESFTVTEREEDEITQIEHQKTEKSKAEHQFVSSDLPKPAKQPKLDDSSQLPHYSKVAQELEQRLKARAKLIEEAELAEAVEKESKVADTSKLVDSSKSEVKPIKEEPPKGGPAKVEQQKAIEPKSVEKQKTTESIKTPEQPVIPSEEPKTKSKEQPKEVQSIKVAEAPKEVGKPKLVEQKVPEPPQQKPKSAGASQSVDQPEKSNPKLVEQTKTAAEVKLPDQSTKALEQPTKVADQSKPVQPTKPSEKVEAAKGEEKPAENLKTAEPLTKPAEQPILVEKPKATEQLSKSIEEAKVETAKREKKPPEKLKQSEPLVKPTQPPKSAEKPPSEPLKPVEPTKGPDPAKSVEKPKEDQLKPAVQQKSTEQPKSLEKPKQTETSKSVEPSKVSEPTKSVELSKPDAQQKLTEPPKTVEPPKSTKSADSVKSVESVKSTELVKPVESVKAVESVKPAETGKSAAKVKPTESIKPVESVKSAVVSIKPAESIKPVESVKLVEATKSVESVKQAETVKPVESLKTAESIRPTEATKSVESVKPTELSKSVEEIKSVDKSVAPQKAVDKKTTEKEKGPLKKSDGQNLLEKSAGLKAEDKSLVASKSKQEKGELKEKSGQDISGKMSERYSSSIQSSTTKISSTEIHESYSSAFGSSSMTETSHYGSEAVFESSSLGTSGSITESAHYESSSARGKALGSSAIQEKSVTITEVGDDIISDKQISTTLNTSATTDKSGSFVVSGGKPFFSRTLEGCSVEPGTDAAFEVLMGACPDTFSWLKDNKPMDNLMSDRATATTHDDNHKFRLEIKKCQVSDSGTYTAVATNKNGRSTCTAQLLVHELTSEERKERDAPVFLIKLKDTELLEDTYLRFMVKVKGNPMPEVTFYKDGSEIKGNSENILINKDAKDLGFYELIIPCVKAKDAGSYSCVAYNKFGDVTSEAAVTVTASKKLFEDLPKTDNLLPKGEKPKFMWRKDGMPFEPEERFKVLLGDDEDSLALVFQHVKPEDVGLYTCVAQTSSGHISCSAELTVQGAVQHIIREPIKPELIVENINAEVLAGGTAMLELQVKGYPKPFITWTHEGKPIEPGGKYKFLYDDEQNMSLMIKNVTPQDAGTYVIDAKNELGSDSAHMELIVKAPPKFKGKVEDTVAMLEEVCKLTVEIEGIPKPTVTFYKDGQPLSLGDHYKLIEEGDNYTLVINKAQFKDTGSYSVVAANEMAQVSQFFKVDVQSKPKVIKDLGKHIECQQGEEVTLSMKMEAEPAPEIHWYKGTEEIVNDKHFVISKDGDTYMLKISGAVSTDSAKYAVKAKNIHGTTDCDVRVDVHCAPKILKPLADVTATEEDKNVEFNLKLQAYPKPTVKWFLDEMEITEKRSEFTRVEEEDELKLVIKEVTSELSGRYTCKLVNEHGETETSAKLTVNCKPHIIKKLQDTVVDEGATLLLQIEVDVCPSPSVKWLKNGNEVSADARIKITRDSHRHETYNLAVDLVKYEDHGEYEVIVQNTYGTISCKSTVTVQTAPKILDSNMEDGLSYESLKQTYVIKCSGNPQPDGTWLFNGESIITEVGRVTIIQEGEEYRLEITPLKEKDGGTYTCKLSNVLGEEKRQAKLDVLPEAEYRKPIVKQPLTESTCPKGQTASRTAVITGDPVPEVTWYRNGEKLEKSASLVIETQVKELENNLKEVTYALTIPRCGHVDTGDYKIKAKNKWGECESIARLTVVLKPEIEGPKDVLIVPGEATELSCIIHACPDPVVTWSREGTVMKNSDAYEIVADVPNELYKLIFKKVSLADEVEYTVTAKNSEGETISKARLRTTTEKPKFITSLTDTTVPDYGEFSLRTRSDGIPRPEARWLLNGNKIVEDENHKIVTHDDGQVVSELTVTHFNEKDVGRYSCISANCVGDAETTANVHMAQTVPTFTKRLEPCVDVDEDDVLELKAKIHGSPLPQVAWFKDGKPIDPDDSRISTSVTPDGFVKLRIERAVPGDSGAYKLVIANKNGDNASQSAVAVQRKPVKPKFLKGLEDTKAIIGEPLRLEAKIDAHPAPEVKWFKDGVPIRPQHGIAFETHPDGRVALTIDRVEPEHPGAYTLVLSNRMGEATSAAQVDIGERPRKPEFVVQLKNQTVVEGFPAVFEVRASGCPTPEVSWARNGSEVVADRKHVTTTTLSDGSHVLLLEKVTMADAKTYSAVATNPHGEAKTSGIVTVESRQRDGPDEKPQFLHSMRDAVTDEGLPLRMEVPFSGNPIGEVTWTKNGEPLEPSNRVILTCDGKKLGLCIFESLPSDSGVYAITMENPLGSDTTQAKATVRKIYCPPKFTQTFSDLQQLPTYDAKFPAKVTGVPQPVITWSKDGQPIHDGLKYRIKHDGDTTCLYVRGCEPEDAGIYKCSAHNKEGDAHCEATLSVVDKIQAVPKKEAPTFLKRIGDTELYPGMTAKFTACASGHPEPEVEWFRDGLKLYPTDRIHMERDRAGLLRLTISGVTETDLGKYSCRIHNEYGNDTCEANLTFDSMESKGKRPLADQHTEFDKHKKSGAPLPLADPPIISQMTDRHCTLSWKPSIPSGPRFPVTYQLEMCELPNGNWFTVRTGIRSCACGVRNLEPFRDYKFRVLVENMYGVSDPSPYAVTHRSKLEPDLPKFLPYLEPGIDFRPETSPYFPKDFDIEHPPHGTVGQAPQFLRREQDVSYGVKGQNSNLFWFVYGYPKPEMTYYFNDEPIESGGRFDMSYTRSGQATLFINKMLERDVGMYEAVARNEHGEARQRVRLEIAEHPMFLRRPAIEHAMVRGKVRFDARIIGVPYPDIKWYKDWQPLAASSRTKIQFIEPDTAVLIINDAILKDEGLYSVSARNVAGTASSSAMLYVEENDLEYAFRTYSNHEPIKLRQNPLEDTYDLGDELGRGTQGITYHAVERKTGLNFAAKVMHGRSDRRPMMYNEFDVMNFLKHKKLIRLHDAYERDNSLALITELAAGGELVRDTLLKQDHLIESEIAGYIRQILWGLEYIHEHGYAHLGLTIGDLLIAHPGGDDLKIGDFGLARRITLGQLAPQKYGVPEYVSPETANGEGVGLSSDMWSLGIITYILLSGISPFRGNDDRETLNRVKEGKWSFDDQYWKEISEEARDFISKLLVYQSDGRMDVKAALRHPWLERADKIPDSEYQISTERLRNYYFLFKDWYDNASCRKWFRTRPLEGAYTHPSRMVYPPGEYYTPEGTPEREPRKKGTWEDQIPGRPHPKYEIGVIKSESHYQNGPDTYLLQLRDVDFPVRLRKYMKVAANRGPGRSLIISDDNGYDWRTPIIRERRRFTDIMDEEIDDERKSRINQYGTEEPATNRRLKHELAPDDDPRDGRNRSRSRISTRLEAFVEAEAMIESKHEGYPPFFREKPSVTAIIDGQNAEITCFAVGDPKPIVQWFKNDSIVAESTRTVFKTDAEGRSIVQLLPALSFDVGIYKVVARNKVGQTVTHTRLVQGTAPDAPDSPEVTQISDTEALLTWRQPKYDGHSPVLCYSVQYKFVDDVEWTDCARNVDHEFYLVRELEPEKAYVFRLASKNAIGWSDQGVPSALIRTKEAGAPKIQISSTMMHLQHITDSGQEVVPEVPIKPDYTLEFQPPDWIKDVEVTEHYNFISEIYKGQFSAVVKGVDKRSDAVVVAKLLEVNPQTTDMINQEFATLRTMRHERIAGLIAVYYSTNNSVAAFILEKMQGADVLTFLASKHEYSEQVVATIVSQVLDGLQYLHWRGYCHLNIQPDNVVMCALRSVQVKLVDMGCAQRVSKLGTTVRSCGHPDYISPEVLNDEPAIPQTDIWSLGVLTYVMLSGTLPFRGADAIESRKNITFVRYRFENLFKEVSQEAVRFLMLVFKRTPAKRPTAEESHEHRWFLNTDYMSKKRERAVFLGNRLKAYSDEYHNEKSSSESDSIGKISGRINRSHSIRDELLSTP